MALDRRVVLFVGLAIIVGVIFIGLTQVITPRTPQPAQNQAEQTPSGETPADEPALSDVYPLTDSLMESLSEQTKQEFNFAFEQARIWRADAVFTAAHVAYTDRIDPVNGKNTFVFSSPALPTYYWTITIDQQENIDGTNNYERTIYYTEDYAILAADTINAPLQYYSIDYIQAIKTADDLGGKVIRSTNETYDVTATLSARRGELLVWHVTYRVDDQVAYEVDINAFTGEEVLVNVAP